MLIIATIVPFWNLLWSQPNSQSPKEASYSSPFCSWLNLALRLPSSLSLSCGSRTAVRSKNFSCWIYRHYLGTKTCGERGGNPTRKTPRRWEKKRRSLSLTLWGPPAVAATPYTLFPPECRKRDFRPKKGWIISMLIIKFCWSCPTYIKFRAISTNIRANNLLKIHALHEFRCRSDGPTKNLHQNSCKQLKNYADQVRTNFDANQTVQLKINIKIRANNFKIMWIKFAQISMRIGRSNLKSSSKFMRIKFAWISMQIRWSNLKSASKFVQKLKNSCWSSLHELQCRSDGPT